MMHRTPRVVGVLLAAGAGRRYGMPKVLVDDWLSTAVAALHDGGCAHVVLVLGAAQVAPPEGVTAVTADQWRTGLSASLRTGLMQAQRLAADYAVLHVIDTPDVGADAVARVLARAMQSANGIARATYGHRPGHPVVLAKQHWAHARTAATGDRGAAAYLDAIDDVELVDCADLASGRDHDEPPTAHSQGLPRS